MRYCMFICCLVAVASLGCGKSSGPQTPRGDIPVNLNSPGKSAEPQGEPATPHHGAGPRADYGSGPEVRLADITLTAPAAWKRNPKPSSSFYLAEFTLPHAGKDSEDGRVVVSIVGGPIESNIDLWKGQIDGAGDNARQEKKEIAGLAVTFLDLSGEYNGQHGQSAAGTSHPGYRMIVAVIPIGDQLHFIKAVGPQQTIAAHVEAINAFVGSLKRNPEPFLDPCR